MAAKPPHFPAKAKSVIWCFLDGGPSHIDLFDPKPTLNKLAGQPLPASFARPMTAMGKTAYTPLLASQRKFTQHGQSGIWVSDWYPEIATCVDDIAVIRSCWADGLNHVGSVCQMNTGSILAGRPCAGLVGALRPGHRVRQPARLRRADRLPATSRPAAIGNGAPASCRRRTRARNSATARRRSCTSRRPTAIRRAAQRGKLDFIQQLNRQHLHGREDDDNLEARIAAYELAYRMQAAAPEAVDLSERNRRNAAPCTASTSKKPPPTAATACWPAGWSSAACASCSSTWARAASGTPTPTSKATTASTAAKPISPIAGLLKDLKRRGLLDSTLVIWGGEFGRTPMSESGTGRDHNPYGFTMWMAGGGIKRRHHVYGATDEIGLYAVENKAHVHDIHATILHCWASITKRSPSRTTAATNA